MERLPFDLRQLRCLVYECDPEAADKAQIRRPFADTMHAALRAVLSQPATHRLPDIRVKATRGTLVPGIDGEDKTAVVTMTVENHSQAPLNLASIGLVLPPEGETPRGLWLTRDIMGRPNAGGRIEPGDRYDFMFAEADFPTEEDGELVLCVEATDRIGRHFRSNEAEFAKLAEELTEVRKKGRKPSRRRSDP